MVRPLAFRGPGHYARSSTAGYYYEDMKITSKVCILPLTQLNVAF